MQENNGAVAATAASSPASAPATPPATNVSDIDQAQFEADKRAVYKHPLFSLLALLLEKCEQATQGYLTTANTTTNSSSASSPNGSTNGASENDSFARDIQAFVHLLEKEKRPLLTNNSELDGLMIKALQVLRIHLLELEKVQELCRDFCTRYIACLRGKMQSENLLRSDYALEHNNNLSNSNSPINTPEQDGLSGQAPYYANSDYLSPTEPTDFSSIQGAYNIHNNSNSNGVDSRATTTDPNSNHSSVSHIPSSEQATTPQPINHSNTTSNSPIQHHQHPAMHILGATPLSQIGCHPAAMDQYAGQLSPSNSSDEMDSDLDSNNDELGSNYSSNSGSKRQKRGILPKHATSVMRAWLFQHLVHPYPTEDEKRTIAAQTNLTLLQVNNWFINARRRILQPMLEQTTENNSARKKPLVQQNSPIPSPPISSSKRYWPENLSTTSNRLEKPNPVHRLLPIAASAINPQTVGDHFYSSGESNDSLIIDQEN